MRSGTRQEFRFFQRFESLDDFRYQPPLFFQGSTQVTASKEIPTSRERHVPGFLRRVWAVDVVSRCRGVAGRAAMKR